MTIWVHRSGHAIARYPLSPLNCRISRGHRSRYGLTFLANIRALHRRLPPPKRQLLVRPTVWGQMSMPIRAMQQHESAGAMRNSFLNWQVTDSNCSERGSIAIICLPSE